MTIDHFRPKSLFPRLVASYSNLHYCCNECNTYKADRWPSDAELTNGYRFVEACVDDPDEHYEFVDLVMKPRTRPAEFTVSALRLDRPALLSRRRAIASRRTKILVLLDRIDRVRAAAVEDLDVLHDIDEVRADLLSQLQILDSPPTLES